MPAFERRLSCHENVKRPGQCQTFQGMFSELYESMLYQGYEDASGESRLHVDSKAEQDIQSDVPKESTSLEMVMSCQKKHCQRSPGGS